MKSRILASTVAALTLAVVPVAVQGAPVARTAAPMTEESELRGKWLWIVAAIAAVIAAILLLDDNEPTSP